MTDFARKDCVEYVGHRMTHGNAHVSLVLETGAVGHVEGVDPNEPDRMVVNFNPVTYPVPKSLLKLHHTCGLHLPPRHLHDPEQHYDGFGG